MIACPVVITNGPCCATGSPIGFPCNTRSSASSEPLLTTSATASARTLTTLETAIDSPSTRRPSPAKKYNARFDVDDDDAADAGIFHVEPGRMRTVQIATSLSAFAAHDDGGGGGGFLSP